jgi:hypothetical protein
VEGEYAKFHAILTRYPKDREFLLKVISLSHNEIPPWALWDALEAVKRIGPHCPIAYFRTVLKDNCRKANVDLNAELPRVRVPENLI